MVLNPHPIPQNFYVSRKGGKTQRKQIISLNGLNAIQVCDGVIILVIIEYLCAELE
jgi:hypothetical protein